MLKKNSLIILISTILTSVAIAQDTIVPVGYWQSHLPYSSATGVASAEDRVYFTNGLSLVEVDRYFFVPILHNKITGLSDMGISRIRFNKQAQRLIIAYTNGNIDAMSKEGDVDNYPAILNNDNLTAGKNINHIYCDGNLVYLSCDFGLTVLDLSIGEFIRTTFMPQHRALSCTRLGDTLFVGTNRGVYKASLQSNLLDFQNWRRQTSAQGMPPDQYESKAILAMDNRVFADANDTLMVYYPDQGTWEHYACINQTNGQIRPKFYTNGHSNLAFVAGESQQKFYVLHGDLHDLSVEVNPAEDSYRDITEYYDFGIVDIAVDTLGETWAAAYKKGCWRFSVSGWNDYNPAGPKDWQASDLEVDDEGTLWVTGSPYGAPQFSNRGSYRYRQGTWDFFDQARIPGLSDFLDHQVAAIHPETKDIYLGSSLHGLAKIDANDQLAIYDQFTPDCTLQGAVGDNARTRVYGLAFDEDNNLWVSNHAAVFPLSVLRPDGTWKRFSLPYSTLLGDITIDHNGNKWIVQTNGNLVVFNEGDLDDDTDNLRYQITMSNELGSETVNCIARDRDAGMWVGTQAGITIFNCPNDLFSSGCVGVRPVVNPDNFNAHLLETENVRCIAVDGANRKWVGTDNGVFLLSADGYEQIYYFNVENSPLFDNLVRKIAIDGETGIVYFATEKGIQAFRGEATQAETTMGRKSVHIFPNPVRPDYEGVISIDDLSEDASVKITDVSGRLVYQTQALGGRAIWDGADYNGRRARSGVYLVFAVTSDGQQKMVSKLVFLP